MSTESELADRAQRELSQGNAKTANELFLQLVAHTHVLDVEYDAWLKGLAASYLALGDVHAAAQVRVYLGELKEVESILPVDDFFFRGRIKELEAKRLEGASAALRFQEAAELYRKAGRRVHAAIASAQAGDWPAERADWQRVLADPHLCDHRYEQALAHFDLGMAHRKEGTRAEATRHLIESQRILEEVADDFETRGERERAFDCYAILLKLGKDSGSFETLAEGYINCIRVLKEDSLTFYVLQYYEDFLRISLEREEFHAAATVFREAAEYARKVGMIYERSYLKRAAETWCQAAEKNDRDGGPIEITENAYLAAVDSYNSIGDFFHIRERYHTLSLLPLSDKKRRRYAELTTRYSEVWQDTVESAPFPAYLRQQHAYPEIWFDDLLEWERDGDPLLVCASMVGDTRYADILRRRALTLILGVRKALPGVESLREGASPAVLKQIALGMGELQSYVALRPLEKLSTHAREEVRVAVMDALKHLYFKRTFVLIQHGLKDPQPAVRRAALESMEKLNFPHAFDPLVRIFREHDSPSVKEAALNGLGRIASLEAGEFLIEVARYEPESLRALALGLLGRFDNPDIRPIIARYVEIEDGAMREALLKIIQTVPI